MSRTLCGRSYAYVEALLDTPGAEYYLEHRVVFPTIAGAFGTADLIVRIGNTIHVIDFKFGAGVRVLALYPDGDEDVINAQLLFYAAAARHSFPEFFAGVDNIVLTILQPQSIEPDAEMVSTVEVTHAELDEFIAVYRAACEEALSEAPRLERGAWCRFCAGEADMPGAYRPLLDLAQFVVPAPPRRPRRKPTCRCSPPAWTSSMRSRTSARRCTIRRSAPLRAATSCPATRSRPAAPCAIGAMMNLPRSPRCRASASAAMTSSPRRCARQNKSSFAPKRAASKFPTELIVSHPSGVSLVRGENARAPVPGRDELVRSFSEALEAFRKEEANHD